jgi:thiol:disulfide interchange protein DsbC
MPTIQQILSRRGQLVSLVAPLLLSYVCAMKVQAQEVVPAAKAAQLQAAIERNTQGKVKPGAVRMTPIAGMYAVEVGAEIFYVDDSGRYGFSGAALIDMQKRKDLTAAHIEQIHRVGFADLPLQHAIKEVRGTGSRKLAVFEDPNCPICKVFTKFVDQLDNVTVYKFMFPVISPESVPLARVAWCSTDRSATWRAIMAGSRPMGGRQDCDTSGLLAILKFGEKFSIQNTPTVFLANGKRLVGATPPEVFMAELNAASAPQ